MSDEGAARKLETALAIAETLFPNAVPILAEMDVRLDDRVDTAAVTPSGRMLVSPAFAGRLSLRHLVFVVAHEAHHVLYGVFARFDDGTPADRRRLVNIAHDFIINDMLEKKFYGDWLDKLRENPYWKYEEDPPPEADYVPKEGLFWGDFKTAYETTFGRPQPPIGTYSIESLVLELEKMRDTLPEKGMLERMNEAGAAPDDGSSGPPPSGGLGAALDALGDLGLPPGPSGAPAPSPDEGAPGRRLPELLSAAEEAALFPDETAVERAARHTRIIEAAELANVRDTLARQLDEGRGLSPGDGDALVRAMDGTWSTPWERALQRWLDDTAPPVRSWAKASRRAGDRTDIVLPGRQKDGFILHIVVDTSGSMEEALPFVFGLIQSFGKTSGVHAARIIQCDAGVSKDEIVDIDDIADYRVEGFGGSDMSPGLWRLAEDPAVGAAVVITDGEINFPPKETVPFDVLWCVLSYDGDASWFAPGYGDVIGVPVGQFGIELDA